MQTRILDEGATAPWQNLSKQLTAIFERRNANVDVEFFRPQNHLAQNHLSFRKLCPSTGEGRLGKTIECDRSDNLPQDRVNFPLSLLLEYCPRRSQYIHRCVQKMLAFDPSSQRR